MSKKVTLPVNENSNYGRAIGFMRKARIYTKAQVEEFLGTLKGKNGEPLTEGAIGATAVVLLSPRETSTRGDCRGNMSNPVGHLMFNALLARKKDKETGKKEAQKYRFSYRKGALEPSKRVQAPKVEAEKVETEVEAPVEV